MGLYFPDSRSITPRWKAYRALSTPPPFSLSVAVDAYFSASLSPRPGAKRHNRVSDTYGCINNAGRGRHQRL